MGVKWFSFIEKFNFDCYIGKFTIRNHLCVLVYLFCSGVFTLIVLWLLKDKGAQQPAHKWKVKQFQEHYKL